MSIMSSLLECTSLYVIMKPLFFSSTVQQPEMDWHRHLEYITPIFASFLWIPARITESGLRVFLKNVDIATRPPAIYLCWLYCLHLLQSVLFEDHNGNSDLLFFYPLWFLNVCNGCCSKKIHQSINRTDGSGSIAQDLPPCLLRTLIYFSCNGRKGKTLKLTYTFIEPSGGGLVVSAVQQKQQQ